MTAMVPESMCRLAAAQRHTLCYSLGGNTSLINHGGCMGKYFIAWLLGIPASLLVLIYLFTHIF
jgi:hypothetical protein